MKAQMGPPSDTGTNVIRISNVAYRYLRANQMAHESLLLTLDRMLKRQLKAFLQEERGEQAG